MTAERVSFRAHLERFPLAVKGALVLRAADGIPHQVVFDRAVVAELAGGPSRPIGLEGVVQDVSPTKDLFVPFEFPSTDLGAGWYRLECRVQIDGTPSGVHPGEPFVVPWPRGATRRGPVDVGAAVAAGAGKVRIEQIACSADRAEVTYEAVQPLTLRVTASGRSLPTIAEAHEEDAGRGSATIYPLLKTDDRVTVEVRGVDASIEVRLP